MDRRIRVAVVSGLGLAAFGFLGAMDYSDALTQDAIEKEARPQRVIASYQTALLGHPIAWDAIVCQAGKCRYYSRSKSQ